MAVIDGKYEVLSQVPLGEGQTLLSATAPDGTALNIVWLELATAQQESHFERYRQALRALKREGLGALHDVVARPGATYIAWYPPGGRKSVPASAQLEQLLASYGYRPEQADIRQDRGGQRVFGLAFADEELPASRPQTAPEDKRPAPSLRQVPLWALRWGLGGLLGLGGVALLYVSFGLSVSNELLTLPELTGQNVNAAARRLYTERLSVSLEPVASERVPFEVVASEPAAGTTLRPGQRVRLSYALPADEVALSEVPDLRGLEFSGDIQTQLETANLKLGEIAYVRSVVKSNFIMAQSSAAGSQVNEGSAVNLLVSEGLEGEKTFLPELTGLPFGDALALAQLAGVSVLEPEERSDGRYPAGTVIAQSIPPYTLIEAREAVLRLSVAGRAQIGEDTPLPSLIGMRRDEAERVAAQSGYSVRFEAVEDQLESLNLPEGVVDQTLSDEATLRLLYNVHPAFIPRPEIVARVLEPEERVATYNFYVEPAIPTVEARLVVTTLEGERFDVIRSRFVRGGERLSGSWRTRAPGPLTFRLYLGTGAEPYAQLTVNP